MERMGARARRAPVMKKALALFFSRARAARRKYARTRRSSSTPCITKTCSSIAPPFSKEKQHRRAPDQRRIGGFWGAGTAYTRPVPSSARNSDAPSRARALSLPPRSLSLSLTMMQLLKTRPTGLPLRVRTSSPGLTGRVGAREPAAPAAWGGEGVPCREACVVVGAWPADAREGPSMREVQGCGVGCVCLSARPLARATEKREALRARQEWGQTCQKPSGELVARVSSHLFRARPRPPGWARGVRLDLNFSTLGRPLAC